MHKDHVQKGGVLYGTGLTFCGWEGLVLQFYCQFC